MPEDNVTSLTTITNPAKPVRRIEPDVVVRSAVIGKRPPLNPFSAPSFPPMVEQAVRDAKLPTLAMDEFANANFGWAGTDTIYNAYAEGVVFLGYSYLATLAQRAEYRVVTETIASEMTREWIELKVASDDESKTQKKKQLEDELDKLGVRYAFRKAAESDGFFGRGHLYLDTGVTDDSEELLTDLGDGRNMMSQLKIGPEKAQKLLAIRPVEATWAYPTHYESTDPLKRDWYAPVTWYVMSREVHRSRLLTFIGREVPDILKPAYAFGGLSMSQMLKPYVDNWLRTRQSVSDLVQNFSFMVLRTNMDATTSVGGDQLFARVALFNNIKNNQGTVVIDKETEDWSNVSAPLGSLDHLQAQAQEHMAAISRIPLVKLLGIQPAGLNASSEGELISFEDWVAAFQETLFRKPLTTVIDLVQLGLWGEIDHDITFDFKPLRQLQPTDEAQLEQLRAQTRESYMQMGAVDAEEVREALANDPDTPFNGVDMDKPLPPPPGMPGMPPVPGGGAAPPGAGPGAPGGGPSAGSSGGPSGGGKPNGGFPSPANKDWAPPRFHLVGGDAEFKEAEHPRDTGGQFTSGAGGQSGRQQFASRGGGLPNVVYRGASNENVETSNMSGGAGVYVSTDPETSKQWGNVSEYRIKKQPNLLDLGVYTPGANKFVSRVMGENISKEDFDEAASEVFIQNQGVEHLKRLGWDGYRFGNDAFLLGKLSDYAEPHARVAQDENPDDDAAELYVVPERPWAISDYAMDAEADWNEQKHPRAKGGQFVKKGQGEAGGEKPGKYLLPSKTFQGNTLKPHGYKQVKGQAKFTHPAGHELVFHELPEGLGHALGPKGGGKHVAYSWTHTHANGGVSTGTGGKQLVQTLQQAQSQPATKPEAKAEAEPEAKPAGKAEVPKVYVSELTERGFESIPSFEEGHVALHNKDTGVRVLIDPPTEPGGKPTWNVYTPKAWDGLEAGKTGNGGLLDLHKAVTEAEHQEDEKEEPPAKAAPEAKPVENELTKHGKEQALALITSLKNDLGAKLINSSPNGVAFQLKTGEKVIVYSSGKFEMVDSADNFIAEGNSLQKFDEEFEALHPRGVGGRFLAKPKFESGETGWEPTDADIAKLGSWLVGNKFESTEPASGWDYAWQDSAGNKVSANQEGGWSWEPAAGTKSNGGGLNALVDKVATFTEAKPEAPPAKKEPWWVNDPTMAEPEHEPEGEEPEEPDIEYDPDDEDLEPPDEEDYEEEEPDEDIPPEFKITAAPSFASGAGVPTSNDLNKLHIWLEENGWEYDPDNSAEGVESVYQDGQNGRLVVAKSGNWTWTEHDEFDDFNDINGKGLDSLALQFTVDNAVGSHKYVPPPAEPKPTMTAKPNFTNGQPTVADYSKMDTWLEENGWEHDLDESTSAKAVWQDDQGNKIEVAGGTWAVAGPNFTPGDADFGFNALADALVKGTSIAEPAVPTTPTVALPKNAHELLPKASDNIMSAWGETGSTQYTNAEGDESIVTSPSGKWRIWQKGQGTVAEGVGQSTLNAAFEQLHPRDVNGHFIKKSEKSEDYTAGSTVPDQLNGVPFSAWTPPDDWSTVAGQKPDLVEPPINAMGKKISAGVLIQEPDGRVWLFKPKNAYGGYNYSFPKGGQEPGMTLQQTAIKEGWEESGLKVDIVGLAGDYMGDTSVTRYYLAKRTGGTPTAFGPESEGVSLVPPQQLLGYLNKDRDKNIAKDHFWKPTDSPSASNVAVKAPVIGSAVDHTAMEKVGGQLGSNLGGQYQASDGSKYYVKFSKSKDHAANELLAAALYEAAGAPVLRYHPLADGTGIATDWQEPDKKGGVNNMTPAERKTAAENFAVHAWLANWDAAGTGGDNQQIINGKPVTVDTGGALLYRAQGTPKGVAFGPSVTEWDTLRDAATNPDAAKLFGQMDLADLQNSVGKIAKISNNQIQELVAKHGPGDPVATQILTNTLIKRRDDLIARLKQAEGPELLNKSEISSSLYAHLQKASAKVPPNQAQFAGIKTYTGGAHRPINIAMRQGLPPPDQYVEKVMHLNHWLSLQSFPGDESGDPVTVTHWIDGAYAEKVKNSLKVGSVFADTGFCSSDHWSGGLTMKIRLPKGAKAAAVKKWSSNAPEDEIIIKPGSKFITEGLAKDKDGRVFIMARYLFEHEPDWHKI